MGDDMPPSPPRVSTAVANKPVNRSPKAANQPTNQSSNVAPEPELANNVEEITLSNVAINVS